MHRTTDSLSARLHEARYIREAARTNVRRAERMLHKADMIVRQRERELRNAQTRDMERRDD